MEYNRVEFNFEGKDYFVENPITVDKVVNAIITDMWGADIEEELKNANPPFFYKQFLIEKEKIRISIEKIFERRD